MARCASVGSVFPQLERAGRLEAVDIASRRFADTAAADCAR
jgi:hypothetical protein